MLSREWKALLVVGAVGVAVMLWLGPWATALPPCVPQQVLDTYSRVSGEGARGEPPATPGMNVMALLLVITFGCIVAYFWWITRPLTIDCRRERDPSSRPRPESS